MIDRYQVKGRRIWDSKTDTYSRLFKFVVNAKYGASRPDLLTNLEFKPLDQWHDDNPASDPVNHPDHYQGKVECIDAIEAALGIDGFIDHCRGTAMKYIYRAGRKNSSKRSKKKYLKGKDTTVQDLQKAVWYLDRAIKAIDEERET